MRQINKALVREAMGDQRLDFLKLENTWARATITLDANGREYMVSGDAVPAPVWFKSLTEATVCALQALAAFERGRAT